MASYVSTFTGDGSEVHFTAGFPVLRLTDLAVVVDNVWLTLGTDYSVSGSTSSALATLAVAPTVGATVVLRSAVGYTPTDPAAVTTAAPTLNDTDTALWRALGAVATGDYDAWLGDPVAACEAAVAEAEAARDAALTNGEVYATTAAGLAGTTLGEYFNVLTSGDVIIYLHAAGPTATEAGRYPTSAKIDPIYGSNFNTAVGTDAAVALTTGPKNTAVGYSALGAGTTSDSNTAVGYAALGLAAGGNYNAAVGYTALQDVTTGARNAAIGYQAGENITTGSDNTGIGAAALGHVTTVSSITAVGSYALHNLTTGVGNTAVGADCLSGTQTGAKNTAVGASSTVGLTTGARNSAVGFDTLKVVGSGSDNVAVGNEALIASANKSRNVAVGSYAGGAFVNGTQNVLVGYKAGFNAGDANTVVGDLAASGGAGGMVAGIAVGQGAAVNCSGTGGIAVGGDALNDATGDYLVAVGWGALKNCTADNNVAVGRDALTANTTGYWNTAVGYNALKSETVAHANTAVGYGACASFIGDDPGSQGSNTAFGFNALNASVQGSHHTAIGSQALMKCTGADSTGIGYAALFNNVTGSYNVAVGFQAGFYETGSSKLFLDNQDRGSEAAARTNAMVYGEFNADPDAQLLRLNAGLLQFPHLPVYVDNAAAVSGGLAVGTVYRTSTGELRIVV